MAGTLVIDTLKSSTTSPPVFQNTSGTEIGQLCRAWVNFNGSGGASIRASFNVSSVTRLNTGQYQVNFTNSFADANYAVLASAGQGGYNGFSAVTALDDANRGTNTSAATTVSIYVPSGGTGAGRYDAAYVQVAVFR